MATNLSIDPELIDRALVLSGERTKKAAVTKALQEFIARREQKNLLDLFGKLDWDVDYDYKVERSRKGRQYLCMTKILAVGSPPCTLPGFLSILGCTTSIRICSRSSPRP